MCDAYAKDDVTVVRALDPKKPHMSTIMEDNGFEAENNNYFDNDTFEIVTDPLTGVEYITNKCNGFNADYGSAICVRVDQNGKPIINHDWIRRQKSGY